MKTIFGALALLIAVPAAAQTAPAPAPKADCCEKMKAEGKECCCKDNSKMDHSKMDHSKMDHSKMDHSKHNTKAGGAEAAPEPGHAH